MRAQRTRWRLTRRARGPGRQNRAVRNLFQGPNLIEDVAVAVRKLERGELKPRVRALEAERALARVQARPLRGARAPALANLAHAGARARWVEPQGGLRPPLGERRAPVSLVPGGLHLCE
jgi:hypothetical protein